MNSATEVAQHSLPAAAPRRWRLQWTQLVAASTVVAGAAVMLYPQTAAWFSQRDQSRVVAEAEAALDQPPHDEPAFRDSQLDSAREYNDALASGAVLAAGANVPASSGAGASDSLTYADLLAGTSDGFMARLRYDDLGIDLPVYHGTSDETLVKGVGHLEGTSLPVGGPDTRAVLTAHRGLATATMFTHLDEAELGDTFTITVLGAVLAYRVRDTQVIDPEQTEMLSPEPGEDLVTLVTCTPLGINTQRILVTGERVTPTPLSAAQSATAPTDLPGPPWWAVIGSSVILVAGAYVWRAGYSSPR